MTIDSGFIIGTVTLGLTCIGTICGVCLWVFNIKAKGEANAAELESALELVNVKLAHANEYINHLIEEGKNFKLIQGGFQNTQTAMHVSIARIETKQDAAMQTINEIKQLLKKAS